MKKRKMIKDIDISKLLYKIWKNGQNLGSGIIVPSGKKFLSTAFCPGFIKHYKIGDINNKLLFDLYINPAQIKLDIIKFVFESINDLDITLQSLLRDVEKIISKDLKGLENIFKDVIFKISPDFSITNKDNKYKFYRHNIKKIMDENIRIIGWKRRDNQSYKVKLSKLIRRYEKEKIY